MLDKARSGKLEFHHGPTLVETGNPGADLWNLPGGP